MVKKYWGRVLSLLLTIGLTACSEPGSVETLRVLAWPGYADPDLVATFERDQGVKVEVSFVQTDDELWERISANLGADYDVFAVNTAELKRYIESGLSQPLDLQKIPNIRHQLPRFRELTKIPGISRDGQIYAIPYTFSEMGLIYDPTKVQETPTSMAALWDPRYQGRALAYDGSNHNFSISALLLGRDNPFQLTEPDFQEAHHKLVELRRNVLTFYRSPEEVVELFRGNDIAVLFGNYGTQQVKQLRDAGFKVQMIAPKEGVLAWLDCWSMTRGAKNPELVARWINYMLQKPVSQALSDRQGLANTITPSLTSGEADRIMWLEPMEDYSRRLRLWEAIRSGEQLE